MNLRALGNTILFKFVDAVNSKGEFEKGTTSSGILLQATVDDSAKMPRWVTAVEVGPDCTSVKVGQQVLLPALRWTAASKFEGESFWKTDETQAAAVRDTPTSDIRAIGQHVLFKPTPVNQVSSSLGLIVISAPSDTPSGTALIVGPDVTTELVASKIYYDGMNFFDTFVHDGVSLAFVKEENILAYEPLV